MRSEFSALQAAFDKLPGIGNNAQQFVRVNAGGTALESVNNSVARTGLGLGTISTQDSNNVALTGGTVKGVSALTTNNAAITGGTLNNVTVVGTYNNVSISGPTAARTLTLPDANLTIPAVTAKGDMLVASGSGILARDAVGTDFQIRRADSTQTNGVKWDWPASPIAVGSNISARTNSVSSNTKFDMNADTLVLKDTNGGAMVLNTVAVTVDMSVVGANGIDAGAQASSTWYYGWVIAKPDGTKAGLASLSSSAPTMPSGYTFKALVTAVRSDGSTHFTKFRQVGNEVYFEGAQAVLTTGTATTETSVTVTSVVPTIAQSFKASVFDFGGTVAAGIFLGFAHIRIVTGTDFVPAMQLRVEGVSAGAIQRTAFPSIDVPNIGSFFYLNEVSNGSSPSMSISISGFKLPLGGE